MMEFFGIAAGIVGIVGYVPYIRDTLKGVTQPDRISWLIWGLEYTALFFAQISIGATHSLWLIGLQLLGVLAVCLLSINRGVGGFDKHKIVLIMSVCTALLVWFFTKNAEITIYILLAVEASGIVLTSIKVYRQPGSETLSMWMLVGVAGLLGILAVGNTASGMLYVYPISLVLMSTTVIGASYMGARVATGSLQEGIQDIE